MRWAAFIVLLLAVGFSLPSATAGETPWSFRPIGKPAPPIPRNPEWVKNSIDTFTVAKLEQNGLTPAPVANKLTLLRRVYFDLIGLPPTPEDIEAFTADKGTDAFSRLI
ncbi:MAG: hypothetical protein DME26_09375, partial [Verrucomicrobia bacterium]